ncbi:MAG: DUF2189 domain-containing protein [Sulfitobacter sp.]
MNDLVRHHGIPALGTPDATALRRALSRGWADFRAAPWPGLIVGALCVAVGWGLLAITAASGHTFWLVLAVFGFPLAAPFAAFGLYEVSRRRTLGASAGLGDIATVLWAERLRQLPWLSAMMIVVLLFWFFLGHMIFALFLGLKPMTNIMSSAQVFLSADGLAMIGMGSVIGGLFALLLFSVCVIGLPLLLDREVDYVTAMIHSIGLVARHPVPMLAWALAIAVLLFLGMVPGFLGLLIVMPWLGHASWHLYDILSHGDAPQSA